jgi:uncharacterized protein (DUF885 family)
MLDRRSLLLTAAAAGLAPLAGCATAGAGDDAAAQLRAALDRAFAEQLRLQPQQATSLGTDTGANAPLKSRLNGASAAEVAALNAARKRWLADAQRVDRRKLTGLAAVDYDAMTTSWTLVSAAQDRFPYANMSYPTPYVLSQLTGSYQATPDFLDSQHTVKTAADAEAYLARLRAFARNMGEETARFRRDTAAGIVPPDFVLDRALTQMRAVRATPASRSPLVQSLVRKTRDSGVAGDWGRSATRIYDGEIRRALDEQIAAVSAVRPRATHDAGVWKLPNGAELYAASLKIQTTTELTPDQIHELGLRQVAEITARMDAILRGPGHDPGLGRRRVQALGARPQTAVSQHRSGKTELLADLANRWRRCRPACPSVRRLPKAGVEARRVPPEIEAGPRAATTSRRPWTARGPAPTTSTCATRRSGPASLCPR